MGPRTRRVGVVRRWLASIPMPSPPRAALRAPTRLSSAEPVGLEVSPEGVDSPGRSHKDHDGKQPKARGHYPCNLAERTVGERVDRNLRTVETFACSRSEDRRRATRGLAPKRPGCRRRRIADLVATANAPPTMSSGAIARSKRAS